MAAKGKPAPSATPRRQAQAQALRDNLRRRKQQQAARRQQEEAADPAPQRRPPPGKTP